MKRIKDFIKRLSVTSETAIWAFALLPIAFILFNLKSLDDVFTLSPAYGSDMGSHYYNAWYLTKKLLPNFTIFGWDQGSFAGYPTLQFYHPLPFLLTAALSVLMPLPIAFKLIVLISALLLPVAAFSSIRLFGLPRGTAALGSLFTLLTLYHFNHQIYGGNLASVFCGEFCFALANGMLLILMATLYRGLQEGRMIPVNIILISAIGLTHLITFSVSITIACYFLIFRPTREKFFYLLKCYGISFLLTAFFMLPLVFKKPYTASLIDNAENWYGLLNLKMLFPGFLLPCYGLIMAYILDILFFRKQLSDVFCFCIFCMTCAAAFYIHNFLGWPSRYIPIMGVLATLTAAIAFYRIFGIKNIILHLFYISVLILILIVNSRGYNSLVGYAFHSFSGTTRSKHYNDFLALNNYLKVKGNLERFVAERGTSRNLDLVSLAFSYAPYLSGVNTLEGLYGAGSFGRIYEKSIGEALNKPKKLTDIMYAQLHEFNVGWIVAISRVFKSALDKDPRVTKAADFGDLRLYHINESRKSHIEVLSEVKQFKSDLKEWKVISAAEFSTWSTKKKRYAFDPKDGNPLPELMINGEIDSYALSEQQDCIASEILKDQSLEFTTNCPNKPHLIRISFFPDWKVIGADTIYLVNPGFMLIYPKEKEVKLYYSQTTVNTIGNVLSIFGLVIFFILAFKYRKVKAEAKETADLALPGRFKKLFIVFAVCYISYGVPNGYYNFKDYFHDYRIIKNIAKLAADRNYAEVKKLSQTLTFIGHKNDKNYWLAKSEYFLKNYDNMKVALYAFINNRGDSEKISELIYYNMLSKFDKKRYDEMMHELFMLNKIHAYTPWCRRANLFIDDWKKMEPQLYEQHLKFYK